jgi:hypothetical protein
MRLKRLSFRQYSTALKWFIRQDRKGAIETCHNANLAFKLEYG